MKINNVVIENQSPEFAVELKKFWERMGVDLRNNAFINHKIGGDHCRFYGIINGRGLYHYRLHEIPSIVQIFHHIPTDAELGLEEITFPCEMEVWDEEGERKLKRKIVTTFQHNDGKKYVEFDESINEYFVYKNATPLPKTLPLTLSELLKIASEVNGVQVTLKEEGK
jgi:hypothetical protein